MSIQKPCIQARTHTVQVVLQLGKMNLTDSVLTAAPESTSTCSFFWRSFFWFHLPGSCVLIFVDFFFLKEMSAFSISFPLAIISSLFQPFVSWPPVPNLCFGFPKILPFSAPMHYPPLIKFSLPFRLNPPLANVCL